MRLFEKKKEKKNNNLALMFYINYKKKAYNLKVKYLLDKHKMIVQFYLSLDEIKLSLKIR